MAQDQTTITIKATGPVTVEKSSRQPSDDLVPIQFKMPPEFVQQFKQEALNQGVKLNELFALTFKAWLQRRQV